MINRILLFICIINLVGIMALFMFSIKRKKSFEKWKNEDIRFRKRVDNFIKHG